MSEVSSEILSFPDWSDEELAPMVADTPVVFPLEPPPDDARRFMEKEWKRSDLQRYLKRWEEGYVPEIPEALWDYTWRSCDVGSGFGYFSVEQSALFSERAYLAIDKGNRRGGRIAKRFPEFERPNLFAMHGNAIPILGQMPDDAFDLLTIFYPNPWWPKKHRKKRWAYHPLLAKLITLLKPGGEIMLCSNEAFYLSEWRYALQNHPEIAHLVEETYCGLIRATSGRSHFESKYLAAGTPCGEVCFRRRPLKE